MKVLFILVACFLVGCSTNGQQKSEAQSKSEVVAPTEKEMEKAAAKKTEKNQETKSSTTEKNNSKFGKMVTCNYGETERILENKESDAGGCEVIYTKEGAANSIANAQNETSYCQEVVDRIANKLVAAGFTCN